MHASNCGNEAANCRASLALDLLEKEWIALVRHRGTRANKLVRKTSQPGFADPQEQRLGDAA